MRIEYIVVSIVLMLLVFLVVITMLSGVIPNLDFIFNITS
jgi:hypothetical protein